MYDYINLFIIILFENEQLIIDHYTVRVYSIIIARSDDIRIFAVAMFYIIYFVILRTYGYFYKVSVVLIDGPEKLD